MTMLTIEITRRRVTGTFILVAILIGFAVAETRGQVATGGTYSLDQSVIANGGSTNATGGTFAIGGTIGQPVAGQKASGGPFSNHAGFWIPEDLPVTAAHVVLSGRVIQSSGIGIQNIRITMTSSDGTFRSTLTNTFGYFHFDEVEVGQTYLFTATSKRYTFQQAMLARGILAAADDLIFIALN